MSKLPHWVQGCILFCTITGAVFWCLVLLDTLKAYT